MLNLVELLTSPDESNVELAFMLLPNLEDGEIRGLILEAFETLSETHQTRNQILSRISTRSIFERVKTPEIIVNSRVKLKLFVGKYLLEISLRNRLIEIELSSRIEPSDLNAFVVITCYTLHKLFVVGSCQYRCNSEKWDGISGFFKSIQEKD